MACHWHSRIHSSGPDQRSWHSSHSMIADLSAERTYHIDYLADLLDSFCWPMWWKWWESILIRTYNQNNNNNKIRTTLLFCWSWSSCKLWWSLKSDCWNDSLKYCRTWFFCFWITWYRVGFASTVRTWFVFVVSLSRNEKKESIELILLYFLA